MISCSQSKFIYFWCTDFLNPLFMIWYAFLIIILGTLFLFSLINFVSGVRLLKLERQPATFTLILFFFPIKMHSNTQFNGVIDVLKGLFGFAVFVWLTWKMF